MMIILDKSAEQFTMTAKTDKFDDIACLINPYQQKSPLIWHSIQPLYSPWSMCGL